MGLCGTANALRTAERAVWKRSRLRGCDDDGRTGRPRADDGLRFVECSWGTVLVDLRRGRQKDREELLVGCEHGDLERQCAGAFSGPAAWGGLGGEQDLGRRGAVQRLMWARAA
jgi:hypothetical protein